MNARDYLLELERRFPAPVGLPVRSQPYEWETDEQPVSIAATVGGRDAREAKLLLAFGWSAGEATVCEDFKWLLAFEDGRELVDFLCVVGAGLVGHTEFDEFPELDDENEEGDETEQKPEAESEAAPSEPKAGLEVSEQTLVLWRHRAEALESLVDVGGEPYVGEMLWDLGELLGGWFEGPWTPDGLLSGSDGAELRGDFRDMRGDGCGYGSDDDAEAVGEAGDADDGRTGATADSSLREPISDDEEDAFFGWLGERFGPY